MRKLLTLLLIVIVAGFAFAFPAFHSATSDIVAASGSTTVTFTTLNPVISGSNINYIYLENIWVSAIGVLTHTTTDSTLTTDTEADYVVSTVPDDDDMAGTLKIDCTNAATPAWDLYWNGTKVATDAEAISYGGIVVTYGGDSTNVADELELTFAVQSSTNNFVVSYTYSDVYIFYKAGEDMIIPGDIACGYYVPYTTSQWSVTIANSETTYRCKYKVLIQTDE